MRADLLEDPEKEKKGEGREKGVFQPSLSLGSFESKYRKEMTEFVGRRGRDAGEGNGKTLLTWRLY